MAMMRLAGRSTNVFSSAITPPASHLTIEPHFLVDHVFAPPAQ
jgi:hypothetical protein